MKALFSFVAMQIAIIALAGLFAPALACSAAAGGSSHGWHLAGVRQVFETVAGLAGFGPRASPGGAVAGALQAAGPPAPDGGASSPGGGPVFQGGGETLAGASNPPGDLTAMGAPVPGMPEGGGGDGGGGALGRPGLVAGGWSYRAFDVLAAPPNGAAPAEEEAFLPEEEDPSLSAKTPPSKDPDPKETWQVSSCVLPSQIIVNKGENVTLNFMGADGAVQGISVEHYQDQAMKLGRGSMETLRFRADRAGEFRIRCQGAQPAMYGKLIVLD